MTPHLPFAFNTGVPGTVLLVDDDDSVRMYCQHVLELNGWTVLSAANGRAAIRLAETHGSCVRLLITDVIMPGINGRELAEDLRRTHPSLRVLFISGFHEDEMLQEGIDSNTVHFLPKPFRPDTLMWKVWEVLNDGNR